MRRRPQDCTDPEPRERPGRTDPDAKIPRLRNCSPERVDLQRRQKRGLERLIHRSAPVAMRQFFRIDRRCPEKTPGIGGLQSGLQYELRHAKAERPDIGRFWMDIHHALRIVGLESQIDPAIRGYQCRRNHSSP